MELQPDGVFVLDHSGIQKVEVYDHTMLRVKEYRGKEKQKDLRVPFSDMDPEGTKIFAMDLDGNSSQVHLWKCEYPSDTCWFMSYQ